ncbi:hypothetical protein A7982_13356 [Minicystis rosea]|nr:hypothetical protein A7982_13356 [Minicystis rosea]
MELLFVLSFAAVTIGPVGFLLWKQQRDAIRARAWITAGKAMGLRFERRVLPMFSVAFEVLIGERDGTRIEVWSSLAGDERSLHAKACFAEPVLFGLSATTRPSSQDHALRGPEIRTHPLPSFRVFAHDAERATALLARLRKTLKHYPDNGRDLTIDDTGVVIDARAEGTRAEIESFVDEALAVRRRLLDALAVLGPDAGQRQAAEAWTDVAAREHFSLDAGTSRLRGRTDRFDVDASLEHSASLQTVLAFTLREPTRGQVALGRKHDGSDAFLALLGQVATPTGDAAFDARFRASARTAAASAAVLDDVTRAALLDLPEPIWGGEIAGPTITLRADGVVPGDALADTLRIIDRLAAHIAGHPTGGYRNPA